MSIQTPDWVKHAVFYQIFPDRFAMSQKQQQQRSALTRLEPWDAPPTYWGYKGGDLWGVIENLDYLQDLGINAVYFTPIFQSASNHRYHTHDYYQVDPILGGNEAFKALLDAVHERGMKLVLDGVFNHSSRGFFFFHDVLENGASSPWVDWFHIKGWPLSPYDDTLPANYGAWAGLRALPEFNHHNPHVREYLMQIAEYWIKQGIDGWRLDVPAEIRVPGFWQEFRDRVKAINPNAYIVGEIWLDARQWLDGTQFDGVMNYLFAAPTIAFTAGDRVDVSLVEGRSYYPYPAISASEYAQKMQQVLQLYPWEIQLTQLNLLDSHDTSRLVSIAQGDWDSLKLATLLLLTFPGAPSIYYGDEVGLAGGIDPDCRRGFPPEADWNLEILEWHRELIKLRHKYTALRIGDYRVLSAKGGVYVFSRNWENETLIIAINAGTEPEKANFEVEGFARNNSINLLFGEAKVKFENSENSLSLEIDLLPRSGAILSF
ncbi:glycoside hydrolase family 13 protein [Merismopedia glauca]|uniref:Alpha-amylase n=1 Tax=Merismopedia glauca CCAP 1448/3 TaxID=1296344 RepID=A0A2T1C890_9CYAN|nr:glycoside hydrolase family 13 protein [Merismopedia glauca]PSB04363.1 alpha-amylase [Merismopedia glauca CCAP 1448/3]